MTRTLLHKSFFPVLCFFSVYLYAQDPVTEIRHHVIDRIPVSNQNWNIAQSKKNFLIYFANTEGLVEYNGISAKVWRLPYEKAVRSVYVNDSGTIFTGTFEEIGYWKKDRNKDLAYHSLSHLVDLQKNDDIWKIYEQNGKIYFQSFSSVYVYDYQTILQVKPPFTLLFMFPVNNRFLAQVIDHGLYWFNGNRFSYIEGSKKFGSMKVHAIISGSDGKIRICTASDGIFLFDGTSFEPWNTPISDFLKEYTCNAGLSIHDSLFVFGSILNGVAVCNRQGEIVKHYNYSNGLKNNTVLSLFADRNNGLWAGLDEGVSFIDILSPSMYYSNTSGRLGTVYSVYRKNNQLLLGTNHGLFRADISVTNNNFVFENIALVPESQGQVWFLDEHGGELLCGHNDGTFVFEDDRLKKISGVTGGWSVKPLEDRLIESTYTGLVILDKDSLMKWKFRNKVYGFADPVRHVEVDYLGYIWASHFMKGVFKIELNENADSVVNTEYFNSISSAPHNTDVFKINNRIVFTTSENIYAYDYVKDTIILLHPLNEQLGEYRKSTQIIPYRRNQYWLVMENKIALFEISIHFTAGKKLEIYLENGNTPERDIQIVSLDKHTILIPDRQGFSVYNTSVIKRNEPQGLFINQLLFSGKKKNNLIHINGNTIRIPYHTNNLTCYFADPSRFDRKNKNFLYRLPEIENTWHSTSLDNFTYLNLRWGTYTIQIKTDTGDQTAEATFSITVPWYLSWKAFILYFLFLLLLIYMGVKVFRFELAKQKQLLEYEINKNKLESELNYKDQELLFTMRYLIQKNEILTQLKNEIDSIKLDSARYPVKFVKSLEKIIREGLDLQTEEWKNAINNLKLSEQGFFRRLIEYYPNLTPNDLKLCSYLRMNFSTKEIAKLLNISTRGVEISRYRLRKKMDLGHDVNLTEFLMSESFGTADLLKRPVNGNPTRLQD